MPAAMLRSASASSVVFEPVNGSDPPLPVPFGAADEGGVEPCPVAVTVPGGAVVVVGGVEPDVVAELVTTGGVAMLRPALSTNCIRNQHVFPTPQS